jgi:hypothetical protein
MAQSINSFLVASRFGQKSIDRKKDAAHVMYIHHICMNYVNIHATGIPVLLLWLLLLLQAVAADGRLPADPAEALAEAAMGKQVVGDPGALESI